MTLKDKTCVPCRGGTPPMNLGEANENLASVPEWVLTDDATRIERNFKFKNFVEANQFVNRIGEIAETEGHHPDISFGWGYARIVFLTHVINGLHENDFIMAAKVDALV
jgi:4a-hydroxytetrahydrobiopterin dehydratase